MPRWIWLLAAAAACSDNTPPTRPPVDADGDGFTEVEDCDDTSADVFPGADELCNRVDDDCDGDIDEDAIDPTAWYLDEDGDGYGIDDDFVEACEGPAGRSDAAGDCDDTRDDIHPDATDDPCSGEDEDCDGAAEVHVPADFSTIQDAADNTSAGDVICVGPGTWAPVSIDHALTVVSTDGAATTTLDGASAARVVEVVSAPGTRLIGLTITGGTAPLAGGAIWVYQSSDTEIVDCVVDNNHSGNRAVVTISASDGTTVRNTDFSNNDAIIGGALHVLDSSGVTIEDCDFDTNQANLGGAIQADGVTDLSVRNCQLTGNSAANGGGLSVSDGTGVQLEGITFSANTATSTGGALNATTSTDVSLTDSSFSSDSGGDVGGAHFETITGLVVDTNTFTGETFTGGFGAGALSLTDCSNVTITNNVTSQSKDAAGVVGGGNVALSYNTWELNLGFSTLGASGVAGLTLSHETIQDNEGVGLAVNAGSGVVIEDSQLARNDSGGLEALDVADLVMRRTTFTDNSDDSAGGASLSGVLDVEVDDCTFSGNQAFIPSALFGDTGGLGVSGATTVRIHDCDLRDNVAEGNGGGLAVTASTSVTLANNIVVSNEADTGAGIYFENVGSAVVTGGQIATNAATTGGGGVQCVSSNVNLSGTSVNNNTPDNVACSGCTGC